MLQLDAIRLTGGEPTLFKGLNDIISGLSDLNIPLKLTTNGYLLPSMAASLARSGLKSINVSLDAVSENTFFQITRRKMLSQVLNGISIAQKEGLEVKINSVIMKGINQPEIIPLLEYAMNNKLTIRYLELMRMGHFFSKDFDQFYYSQNEILEEISLKYHFKEEGRNISSTTNYWTISDYFKFGIISNESNPFCNDCDRLRLDMSGNIFGCLSNDNSISIKNSESPEELSLLLSQALTHKHPSRFTGSKLSMIGIGG